MSENFFAARANIQIIISGQKLPKIAIVIAREFLCHSLQFVELQLKEIVDFFKYTDNPMLDTFCRKL